jgi:hypothetical protein
MVNLKEAISPLPKSAEKKIKSLFALHKGRVIIRCKECKQLELVDERPFYTDIGHWYVLGLHPRFSPNTAFKKTKQTQAEMMILAGYSRSNNRYKDEMMRNIFYSTLKTARTEEEFISLMHPYLFSDLVFGDTTYRLDNAFKERCERHEFVPDDFFNEDSQELRRLILRSGVSIKDVKGRLELIDKDEEGELYRMKAKADEKAPTPRLPFGRDREPNYLYVVCPSTGQEYLLGVPQNFTKPKDARRWTFGLEPTAEFVKEA